MMQKKIAVCGAGAWGTALGQILSVAGHYVIIAGRNRDKIEHYRETLTHDKLGDDIVLSPDIIWSDDINMAVQQADIIILSVPTQYVAGFLTEHYEYFAKDALIVQTAKGIDIESGLLIHDITARHAPHHKVILLSGPGFARDVVRLKPTAVSIAHHDKNISEIIQNLFENTPIRPYSVTDIDGVALGGAMKNILAIAAGYVMGYDLGESAKAALLTRGFSEIGRLSSYFNAQKETLFGLSCFGDLMLTTSGMESRNYRYGFELAQNAKYQSTEAGDIFTPSYTAEGYYTLKALLPLLNEHKNEFPILESLSLLLSGAGTFHDVMKTLLSRPMRCE